MTSLSKNKEITDLAKLASGKMSERLVTIEDKNITKIIELLDEKYLQTRSEKYEVLSQELQSFKLSQEDIAEASWEKFCKLRSTLRKEDAISDLLLHTLFLTHVPNLRKLNEVRNIFSEKL